MKEEFVSRKRKLIYVSSAIKKFLRDPLFPRMHVTDQTFYVPGIADFRPFSGPTNRFKTKSIR